MVNSIDILQERGFIDKTTHDIKLNEYFEKETVTCYIGFDPTATSLHVGSLVPIMALVHMQKNRHRPIALIGGGTGLIGDPSGKTETRKLLDTDEIRNNELAIKKQLSLFVDFSKGKAVALNNANWLKKLEFIPFLRDIGSHFSVNRMIKAESYKMRLKAKEGLNFIEFNYMLLQAYDFLKLFDDYGCRLQMGGSDQWGNIVAGIELVRRTRHKTVFGLTFPLITTNSGIKMGKTATGAIWLDPDKTTPYEYYQYWISTDDRDVSRFLSLFTFLPMEEIREIKCLRNAELNIAKRVLAFEATILAHGTEEALRAYSAASKMFGSDAISKELLPSSTIPRKGSALNVSARIQANRPSFNGETINPISTETAPHSFVDLNQLKTGIPAFKLFYAVGLTKSGGAARRLVEQGGAYINGMRVEVFDRLVTENDLIKMEIVLRSGKKKFHKIKVKE